VAQATVFRALMAENPNMDLVDLEERMQAGALGKGNFNAVMKQVGMQSGVDTETATNDELLSNRMFLRNVAKVFTGGQIADARGLIEGGRTKGTGEFDVFERQQGQNISGMLMGRAQTTDQITTDVKRLDDILATQKGEMAKTFVRETTKFAENPEDYLAKTLESIPKVIGDKIGEFMSSAGGMISEAFGFGGKETKPKIQGSSISDFFMENTQELKGNTTQIQQLNGSLQKLNDTLSKPVQNQLQNGIKK
jgi:hypothetical protein